MTAFAITVDVLAASIHSKTGFISVMSEIEGLLQSATALNICGIPDSIDLDGFPERCSQTIHLASVVGEAQEMNLIPDSLRQFVDDVVLTGKRFDAEGDTNAWSYGFPSLPVAPVVWRWRLLLFCVKQATPLIDIYGCLQPTSIRSQQGWRTFSCHCAGWLAK